MARRRRDNLDLWEDGAKAGFALLLLVSLLIGGANFARVLTSLLWLIFWALIGAGVLTVVFLVVRKLTRNRSARLSGTIDSVCAPAPQWTSTSVAAALAEIDWYQFEKFCAELLRMQGYEVTRKGGAHPDGGVDLVATRASERLLIQCKHWRTWTVQERVIRELLGSMTHFQVTRGAIYTLKGWTKPAAAFAAEHGITLLDARDLAQQGLERLSAAQLDTFLKPREHHCPKCEAPMILRTGAFGSFWGCSAFPRCRAKLKYAGAR